MANAMNGLILGSNWKQVERIDCPAGLVMRQFTRNPIGFSWLCLDANTGQQRRIEAMSRGSWSHVRSIPGSNRVAFSGDSGLGTYDFSRRRETTLIEWDRRLFSVFGLWPTPDGSILYCFRAAFDPKSISESERLQNEFISSFKRGRTQEKVFRGAQIIITRTELLRIDIRTNDVYRISEFSNQVFTGDVDRDAHRFVAGEALSNEVTTIDLKTEERSQRKGTAHLRGVAFSSSGSVVTWDTQGGPIIEYDGAVSSELTVAGKAPSFSPRSEHMAFLRGAPQDDLWVRYPNGEEDRIIKSEFTGQAPLDTPSWCPCGKHVAVYLPKDDSDRIVAVADVETKSVMTIQAPVCTSGRAWIAK